MKLILFTIILCMTMNLSSQKKAYINGKIYTVNPHQPTAEVLITEGSRISFVGTKKNADNLIDDKTEIIDLRGKLMLPGFIDGHVHFISGGFYLQGINLRDAKSTTEFVSIIKKYAEENNERWITGGNWDHEAWEVKDLPYKEMIDAVTPNTPVLVDRFDGHMSLANSYALQIAGITKDTESPEGGLIVKDPKTGEPTGILKDNAIGLVSSKIPSSSDEEYYKAALTALEHVKQFGITGVQDITYQRDLDVYRKLEKENKLTCRIYTIYPVSSYQTLVKNNLSVNSGSEKLKTGALKAFADGSLGSSTAWFFERYNQDTTTTGVLAIASIKFGAAYALGIDIDEWAEPNFAENAKLNHVENQVEVRTCGIEAVPEKEFDLIAANIQKNVLLSICNKMGEKTIKDGVVILSGLLIPDEDDIVKVYTQAGFELIDKDSLDEWIVLVFRKK